MEDKEEKKSSAKRYNKEEYQGATIYMPRDVNDRLSKIHKQKGVTKAAYILQAINLAMDIDEGIVVVGKGVTPENIQKLLQSQDEISTDIKLIKALLAK